MFRSGLFVFALLLMSAGLPAADDLAAPAAGRVRNAQAATEFFSDPAVPTFQIEIEESGLAALRRSPRTYVKGTLRQGTLLLTNVGIHLKGMGSYRSVDERPSLAVKFDEFVSGQEFRGLTKLMFNNSVQDPTYLAELLATGLFLDAGLPAARVTHARLQLNGRDLGLYVVIEAMNKRFLKRHFGNAQGNLYEGYLADIDTRLDQDNGDNQDQADLELLRQAAGIADPATRFQRLSQLLDVDRFVSFVAMEMLIGHWDGYAIHTNNYRIYHEPGSDKMVFITHGLDWAFRRPNISIQPPTKSIVGRALLQTPPGQQLYRERVGLLFTNVFRLAVLTNRLEQALGRLRSARLTTNESARIERHAAILRERIQLRVSRVADQLAGRPPPVLQFQPDGTARLSGWRDENDRGEPLLDQPERDGKKTLHVQARGGRSRASWRAQVCLERGRYRFEGLLRTQAISGGSAGLRISGDQTNRRLGGTSDWKPLQHEFEVVDPIADIECVCEFQASQGEVWFDVASLQLRRL